MTQADSGVPLLPDLREDSQEELARHLRLEGGRDDDVVAGGHPEPRGDLPRVEEEGDFAAARVVPEEVRVQLHSGLAAWRELAGERGEVR